VTKALQIVTKRDRGFLQNKNPDYSRLNGRAGVRSLSKAFALAMFNK